ncbi:uncharacterized protein LOC143844224 isoform X1 [Paroedura picta]|uniref:uncharacterized protein LOC143844224 isoform X1 n=1 Tax=Paroedura picta TaxID=143630 RepID=UPI00405788E2
MGNGKSRVVQGAEDKKGPRGGGSAVECGACEITIPRSERLRMVRLCSASFVSTVASQEELVVWHLFLDLILAIVSRVVAKHYLWQPFPFHWSKTAEGTVRNLLPTFPPLCHSWIETVEEELHQPVQQSWPIYARVSHSVTAASSNDLHV